jgi:uncharacterized protein (DUF1778 family)
MATELPTDPQIAVDAERYLAQRVLALEAEAERLRLEPRLALLRRERDEAQAQVERLRTALDRLLDANATREHEGMPRDDWEAEILRAEEALAGEEGDEDAEGEGVTTLNAADSRRLAELLTNPSEPNEELRALMREDSG